MPSPRDRTRLRRSRHRPCAFRTPARRRDRLQRRARIAEVRRRFRAGRRARPKALRRRPRAGRRQHPAPDHDGRAHGASTPRTRPSWSIAPARTATAPTRRAIRLARLGYRVKEMIGGITGWRDEEFALERERRDARRVTAPSFDSLSPCHALREHPDGSPFRSAVDGRGYMPGLRLSWWNAAIVAAGLHGLRAEQHLSGAAAAQGHGRKAGRAEGHALFRGDRQYRGGQLGQSGRARAGLPHRGEVHRRHAGEEGRSTSSPSSRSPISSSCSRRRRPKPPRRPRRSRPRPTSNASRNWCSGRPPPRRRSMPRPRSATPTRRRCCRRRPTPSRRRSTSTTPGWSRRSTASSRRARSRSASWSAAAARRCSRPSCSSIRST